MSRLLGDDWLLPLVDDTNRAWFTSGSVGVQCCGDCGHLQHPPDEVCGACQGTRFGIQESAGRGRIESVAVVHHPIHPALAEQVPYAILVVSLDDLPGIHVVGNLGGAAPGEVSIGDAVEVFFEALTMDGETLQIPQWRPIGR